MQHLKKHGFLQGVNLHPKIVLPPPRFKSPFEKKRHVYPSIILKARLSLYDIMILHLKTLSNIL